MYMYTCRHGMINSTSTKTVRKNLCDTQADRLEDKPVFPFSKASRGVKEFKGKEGSTCTYTVHVHMYMYIHVHIQYICI